MTNSSSSQVDAIEPRGTVEVGPLTDDAVSRALEVINRDSALLPERYLSETMVPHGGE